MNNKRVNTISLFLFADDSNLFKDDKDTHILECQLNKEVENIFVWLKID